MSQQTVGFIDYVAQGGDTFDSIALVALSREAAGGRALVAGDLTTTGVPLEPAGTMTYHELFEIYTEQITALAEAGADLLLTDQMNVCCLDHGIGCFDSADQAAGLDHA